MKEEAGVMCVLPMARARNFNRALLEATIVKPLSAEVKPLAWGVAYYLYARGDDAGYEWVIAGDRTRREIEERYPEAVAHVVAERLRHGVR